MGVERVNIALVSQLVGLTKACSYRLPADLMTVHGEQADTILASLLALMARLQSLPCRLLIRTSRFILHVLSSSVSRVKSPVWRVSSLTNNAQTPVRRGKKIPSPSHRGKRKKKVAGKDERNTTALHKHTSLQQGRPDAADDTVLMQITSHRSPPAPTSPPRRSWPALCLLVLNKRSESFAASFSIVSLHISVAEPCMSSCMREDGSGM